MSAAVAILDALRKKPVAEKKKQFSVAFFVASAAPKQRDTEERQERQEEKQEERREKQERQEKPNPTVKIVDKTALKLVNRDDILARIKAARGIVTEAAPNPLNLTVAKVVSIVEEAPVPRLKGKKLQKIKLIPVSAMQPIALLQAAEAAEVDRSRSGTQGTGTQRTRRNQRALEKKTRNQEAD